MKCVVSLTFLILSIATYGQDESMNTKNHQKEFFIATNSGVLNTPIGLKVGFIANPGVYVGVRHGIGEVYNSDSDLTTNAVNLYSITGGINRPFFTKGDFKLIGQLGIGYGQWWDYRWERWTNSGVEVEGGLMIQKGNFLFNITGNYLTGDRTYATGDLCLGIGYTLNNCK